MADVSNENLQVNKDDQLAQNEYIIIINKRIRALKKKLTNINAIEQKIAKKEKINQDQQQLLQQKESLQKFLTEFEAIRNQMVQEYEKEEKLLKEKKPEPVTPAKEPEQPQETKVESKPTPTVDRREIIKDVISVLYASQLFDRNRPEGVEARQKFFAINEGKTTKATNDSEIDSIYYLVNVIFNTPSHNIQDAVNTAINYLDGVQDEFSQGVTYKYLNELVQELTSSRIFTHGLHAPPAEEVETTTNAQQEATTSEDVQSKEETTQQENQVEETNVEVGQDEQQQQISETEEGTQETENKDNDQGFQQTGRKGYRGGDRGQQRGRGGFRGGNRGRGFSRGGRGGSPGQPRRERGDRGGERTDSRSPVDNRQPRRGGQQQQQQPNQQRQ